MDDTDVQRAIEASIVSQQQQAITNHDRNLATKLQQEESDNELAMALKVSHQQYVEHEFSLNLDEWKISKTQDLSLGSWDCAHCTLTNRPYQPNCFACHSKAPLHVLTYNDLPIIRFGLEIEIIIPNGRCDGFTFESIAQNLSRFMERKVRFEGYSHQTRDYWKIVTDSSINSNMEDHDLCFELVSPVLQGEEGLSSMRAIMDSLRRLGVSTNDSCGFHVHVDAEQVSSPIARLDNLKNIAKCFVSLENAFDLLVSLSWEHDMGATASGATSRRANNNRYCKSNRLAFGEWSNKQRWNQLSSVHTKKELVALMNPLGDRHRKLNLTNIVKPDRPSTCEFRQHGGVEDLQEAEAWVRMLLSFCQNAACGGRKVDACLMAEGSSAKDELLALFHLLDCDGLEQFFAVECRLFSEDRLTQEWQCGFCRRPFRTSRSLSQHKKACGH